MNIPLPNHLFVLNAECIQIAELGVNLVGEYVMIIRFKLNQVRNFFFVYKIIACVNDSVEEHTY